MSSRTGKGAVHEMSSSELFVPFASSGGRLKFVFQLIRSGLQCCRVTVVSGREEISRNGASPFMR